MIDRATLISLVTDYRRVLDLVSQAASILDDTTATASTAGELFTRESVRLVTDAYALFSATATTLTQLMKVTCDD